jgi:hypothetical protein
MSSFTRALERVKEVRETGVGSSVMVNPEDAMSMPVLNGLDSGLLVRNFGYCKSREEYAKYYRERMEKRNRKAVERIPDTDAFEREMAHHGGASDGGFSRRPSRFPRFPLGKINAALAADFPGGELVAAGGIVSAWVCGMDIPWNSDVDLFLIDPMAAKAPRSEYARRVLARAIQLVGDWAGDRAEIDSKGNVSSPVETWVSRTTSAVTFAARRKPGPPEWRDIQVVLRAYPSVPALLSDFDHGGCAFAYVPGSVDGAVAAGVPESILAKMSNFEMSHLGSLAFQTGVIALEPEISRRTTLGRLVKYGNRGFDVLLPGAANFVSRREAVREVQDYHPFAIIPGFDGAKHPSFDQVATVDGVLLVGSLHKGYVPKDAAGANSADFYYGYGAEKLTPSRPEQMFRTLAKELPRAGVENGRYFTSCYFRLALEKGLWAAYCRSLAEKKRLPKKVMAETSRAILKQYRKNLISAAKKLDRYSALTMLTGRDVDASAERIERLVKEAGAFLLSPDMWPRFRPRGSNLEEQLTARDDAGFDPAKFYTNEGFPFVYAPNEFDGTLIPKYVPGFPFGADAEPASKEYVDVKSSVTVAEDGSILANEEGPAVPEPHTIDIEGILSDHNIDSESPAGSSLVRLFQMILGPQAKAPETEELSFGELLAQGCDDDTQ